MRKMFPNKKKLRTNKMLPLIGDFFLVNCKEMLKSERDGMCKNQQVEKKVK